MEAPVTAIVLNFRTPLHAVRCVDALKAQTVADRLRIVVVDNHSDDDSAGILRTRLAGIAGVRVMESPVNTGFGAGNALAIARADTPYLLVINPDNELAPDALEIMLSRMEKDPAVGIVAPKLVHEDGSVRDSSRSFPAVKDVVAKRTPLRRLFPHSLDRYLQAGQDPDRERTTDWVVGACMLIRTDVYRRIGGFDERFFLFFEDIDLCRRTWDAGFKVLYCPAAVATDRKRRLSEGGVLSLLRRPAGRAHIRSALRYFAKWAGKKPPEAARQAQNSH